ncbi:C39 family peptidase [Sporosarcina sp. HYO08]|uniref:C39 family peptidase n=1 Tax=Sporosarcina sp. HYO08 TaxID=1759557 RepID=UPI00079BB64C|nr:C39 family peptidase [Sporosarcina sp. HYO08]KXH79258.1 hypothetical protein AU377_11765 [Sporosarcina sp. HYO08]
MKKILQVNGKSQYDQDIHQAYRASACGPVTARVMLDQFSTDTCSYTINELYPLLGGTKIGLFKRRFIRNMQKILGDDWIVAQCSLDEVKQQINKGHLVAAKFDKWFKIRWFGKYKFDYHWVPVIGYEEKNEDIDLIIHDNGSRHHPSRIRRVSYKQNQAILSFVKVEPRNA